ncbi:MAG: hypothetical protein WKF37_02210 [Bryobacteraceae bacterium]
MDRRTFVKSILAAPAALTAAVEGEPILYFVDGYHGGVRGHMPKGAWRDIVTRLGRTPGWKLCLDIEPASWVRLAEDDPQAYSQRQAIYRLTRIPRGRNGGWDFLSAVRLGADRRKQYPAASTRAKVIRASFPHLPVDTPCRSRAGPVVFRKF